MYDLPKLTFQEANAYRALKKACWPILRAAAGDPDLHDAAAVLGAKTIAKRVEA